MIWLCLLFSLPVPGPKMTGVECVEGMASGLYEELFAAVVSLINRYGAAGHRTGGVCGRQLLLLGLLKRNLSGGSPEKGIEQATAAG